MKQKWEQKFVPAEALAATVATMDGYGYDLSHMAATEPGGFGSQIRMVLLFKLRESQQADLPRTDNVVRTLNSLRTEPAAPNPFVQPQRRNKQK